MSMRISEGSRAAALLIAGLALAACEGLPGAGGPSRATVTVAGEPIVIAGPPGFCIDRETLNVSDFGAFALMSDCALLASGTRAGADSRAALTASISSGGLGGEGDDPVQSLADLAAFAQTGEGRALLGRSGSANGVRILATRQSGEVLFVLVEDRGHLRLGGSSSRGGHQATTTRVEAALSCQPWRRTLGIELRYTTIHMSWPTRGTGRSNHTVGTA